MFDITAYGAVADGPAVKNQEAINAAIDAAAKAGDENDCNSCGEVQELFDSAEEQCGFALCWKDSVLRAAIAGTGANQDGGFYDAPEANPFIGLEDHGHAHWANSLIYGIGVKNVTISGPGLIDGSTVDENGVTVPVITTWDPREVTKRNQPGEPGGANKAIALKDAESIILRDFRVKNGGHFAIFGSAVSRWTVDGVVVDTNRDAIDIDACQNVTVSNSVFNSPTDDAIVLKGSFGDGKYLTSRNILIEHDTVSGYDAGSVLDKTYSTHKLVATDRDGPTGRVKFGTEGTSGLDTVAIRDVVFDRSRGFALESVDGAELQNILFANVRMKNVSSSPIFIVLGDRGRAPVTGNSTDETVSPANNVRLTETGWILPNIPSIYGSYPAVRYVPAYDKTTPVSIGGAKSAAIANGGDSASPPPTDSAPRPIMIVNPTAPARLNPNSPKPNDPRFANAVGVGFAKVRNILIHDVVVENADPRYPILLSGLVDHPIENVVIRNVSVEYRGGFAMKDAVEQRQLNQAYAYTPYQGAKATQSVPWMVNTFFSKNEALLPRISWDAAKVAWVDDPYNVPEMTREYPEPSMLGILPAYGLYARHVKGLRVTGMTLKFKVKDERPAIVLDDVAAASFIGVLAKTAPGVPAVVEVANNKKREPDMEYIKDAPYKTTSVSNVFLASSLRKKVVTIDRPAPGTPPDSLFSLPTAPSALHPYSLTIADEKYPLPLTVYRPQLEFVGEKTVAVGSALEFPVVANTPAPGVALSYSASALPAGARFDSATRNFAWTPVAGQVGVHSVRFCC